MTCPGSQKLAGNLDLLTAPCFALPHFHYQAMSPLLKDLLVIKSRRKVSTSPKRLPTRMTAAIQCLLSAFRVTNLVDLSKTGGCS